MKVLVIGDSHGNIQNLRHVVGFGKKIGVKAIIHCGDWNTLQSIEVVLQSKIPLYTVLGNADVGAEMRRMINDQWLKIKLGNKKIGVIHKLTINHQPLIIGCDIVFTGHYHSQKEYEINGVKIVRPGALERGIEFAIYETKTGKIEFVNDKV